MNELCFMSNLTSTEWAAWVQALGAIAAIIGAAWIAIYQSHAQHLSALSLQEKSVREHELALAKTLDRLAANCLGAMDLFISKLDTRQAIHNYGDGNQTL